MAWRSTSTSSTDPGDLLEVGRITKPHGIRGEVVVVLTTDRTERVAPGAVLQTKAGALTVEASRPHQGHWLVAFAGVPTRNDAEALRGTVLLAERMDDPDELWVHELIGARVVDVHGAELGTVESVEDNPAADLLVLDGGGLIPVTFVESFAPGVQGGPRSQGILTVDIPEGLLDL
jgi:16S rRNA processing protein RimM